MASALGRSAHRELEPQAGHFGNQLPIRLDLSGEPTFGDLAQRAAESAKEAVVNDAPGMLILGECPLGHRLGRVVLNMIDGQAPREAGTMRIRRMPLDPPVHPRLPLALVIVRQGPVLFGRLEGPEDLFSRDTVDAWARAFVHVLEGGLADPGRRIADLLPEELA
jgi:hypothetical protein